MSATIEISDDVAEQVRELVKSGAFPDDESAVREAFRLLREHRLRMELRAKLADAYAQFERGDFVEFDEQARQRIVQEGRAKYERGDDLNPDVCP